ncbi:hypothetical protein BC938DRAFT_474390 [Jimgerdemannia flammicorona]|uniref:Uncharacterized protein n=1 Tax=Jimgerdemannia flammicorona TaxID=994334 RepID=A0A433Q290_9FUNG|nr:hypothetical protein BC938DRAFT_474390 [Jimgerdemannia flammicorona]
MQVILCLEHGGGDGAQTTRGRNGSIGFARDYLPRQGTYIIMEISQLNGYCDISGQSRVKRRPSDGSRTMVISLVLRRY